MWQQLLLECRLNDYSTKPYGPKLYCHTEIVAKLALIYFLSPS